MDRRSLLQSLVGMAVGGTSSNAAQAKAIEDGGGHLVCLVLTLSSDFSHPSPDDIERMHTKFAKVFGGKLPAPLFILPPGCELNAIYDRPGIEEQASA